MVWTFSSKNHWPISSAQAEELARLADEHKRIMAVAFNRRYALLYRQAKELFGERPVEFALFQNTARSART